MKTSKIRKIIYIAEGACSLKSYRTRRNALYKEGYTEALIGGGSTRLLTLEELESVGRFFWNNVFANSTRRKIPIGETIGAVFFTPRLAIELLPKANVSNRRAPSVGDLLSRYKNPTAKFLKPRKKTKKTYPEWPNIPLRGKRSTVRIANSGITKRGKKPDPNSRGQKNKGKCKGGKFLKNKGGGKGQKGDSQPTVECAPTNGTGIS